MDTNSEARLAFVYPLLAAKARQLADMAEGEGITIIITQGLRTWSEQDRLWQKGRNADGSFIDPVHHAGVVTYARGGQSWHNLGLAFDIAIENPDHTLDWNASHPQWQRAIAIGISLGLTSGSTWSVQKRDNPHFQLTGRFPEGSPNAEVRQLFMDGGINAVWDEVTRSLPDYQVAPQKGEQ